MDDKRATLPKSERLSSKSLVDALFANGSSFVAYPLRVIYSPVQDDNRTATVSVLIHAPKKKLKRAVDRNFIKRRIRESYRLRKHVLIDALADSGGQSLLVAFLYLDSRKSAFATIGKAMEKALLTLCKKVFGVQRDILDSKFNDSTI
ncbi:MAG: ribonuclease P protein component [Tannerella sp.]|jgi:ribonuclease P protein component|nr:ribonuclease P protein component [Tannerella sp.]